MNTENLVGTTLGGRYDVIEKIGTGGMAAVFKAKDMLLNRYVAIKLLKDKLEGEEQIVSNFIKEAQASASLSHNNVVSVYDVCEENGVNYMVMELVDGITLKEYIKKNGALPWQEACDYALQIAQGIGEAHSKNIIHRDIKPQNVIMTEDKTLKVTDFGIARAMESETTIVGGTALGSVHYISPEQARGGYTDARSDIYSLGIVLYEMLAGKVPFDGDTPVSVALMHLEKEPVNVKCLNMDIPADLAYIVMKAISKEQGARYQNIDEMLDDLHAVLADEPLPSTDGGAERNDDEADEDLNIYDDEYDEYDDEPIEEESHKRTKKRKKARKKKTAAQKKEDRLAVILALGTVLALILIVVGAYKIIDGTKRSTIPNLANMTVEEATQKLQGLDLRVDDEIEYSFSDEIEEDRVITQDPDKGTVVPKNSTVKLIVSIGSSGGTIAVPDTVNKSFDEAISQIIGAGLTYRVIEESSDTIAQGNIIRQIPMAGTKVNKDDIVTLHVSTGKGVTATQAPATVQKVEVPNVIGLGREQAEIVLTERGLRLGTVTRRASDSPEGTIISQSPDSSRTAAKDSYVTIIVSAGTENDISENNAVDENASENNGEEAGYEGEAPIQEENGNNDNYESEDIPEGDMNNDYSSATSSKLFSVKIPSSANDNVNVEIIANGQTIHSGVHSKSEGVVSVEITGSGIVDVQALIDGALAAHKKIDFSE